MKFIQRDDETLQPVFEPSDAERLRSEFDRRLSMNSAAPSARKCTRGSCKNFRINVVPDQDLPGVYQIGEV